LIFDYRIEVLLPLNLKVISSELPNHDSKMDTRSIVYFFIEKDLRSLLG